MRREPIRSPFTLKIKCVLLEDGLPSLTDIEDASQSVWLLSYDGPEAWDPVDNSYYESPKRLAMNPNPARLIARAEEYFADSVAP